MDLQTLRIHHYGEVEADDRRITVAPINVVALSAKTEDNTVQGRSVREIAVIFLDGGQIVVNVNHADLELLEGTIGAFCIE
jgi:hypothetical protein